MLDLIIISSPDNGQIDGVTTFCSCLSNELAKTKLFKISVVTPSAHVQSLTKSYTTNSTRITYYKCPIPSGNTGIGQYLYFIPSNSSCVILLNYWPSMFNIRSIRSYHPKASIVQIVHDFPWLTIFEGNPKQFFKSYTYGFSEFQESERKFLKYSTYDTLISFREADHIICLCNDSVNLITQHYKIPLEKIHLIPNGLTDNFNIQVDEKCYANKEFRELRITYSRAYPFTLKARFRG